MLKEFATKSPILDYFKSVLTTNLIKLIKNKEIWIRKIEKTLRNVDHNIYRSIINITISFLQLENAKIK